MLAFNVTGVYFNFVGELDGYHAIILMSLNAVIVAPIVVSLVSLHRASVGTITGYALCFVLHVITATLSFVVYTSALDISSCFVHQILAILLYVITIFQLFYSSFCPLIFIANYSEPSPIPPRTQEERRLRAISRLTRNLIVVLYAVPVVVVVLVERLRQSVQLIEDTEDDFAFGQIFAIAMIVAPIFEVIKYLLALVRNASSSRSQAEESNVVVKIWIVFTSVHISLLV